MHMLTGGRGVSDCIGGMTFDVWSRRGEATGGMPGQQTQVTDAPVIDAGTVVQPTSVIERAHGRLIISR